MDKIDQQLIESIISVVNLDNTERDQLVMEYLEGYFGDELNESTSEDDIMEAFAKLLETADAVKDYLKGFIGTGDSIKGGSAVPKTKNKKPLSPDRARRRDELMGKKPMSPEMLAFNRSQAAGPYISGIK